MNQPFLWSINKLTFSLKIFFFNKLKEKWSNHNQQYLCKYLQFSYSNIEIIMPLIFKTWNFFYNVISNMFYSIRSKKHKWNFPSTLLNFILLSVSPTTLQRLGFKGRVLFLNIGLSFNVYALNHHSTKKNNSGHMLVCVHIQLPKVEKVC